jgi:hypothetical protein
MADGSANFFVFTSEPLGMETELLETSLSFNTLLADLLEALDQQWISREGRFRPGGRVDLNTLGDDIWLEQFR